MDKSFPNGGFVSIDEGRIVGNYVYEIIDDIILLMIIHILLKKRHLLLIYCKLIFHNTYKEILFNK